MQAGIRLAIRREGAMINAYVAEPGTLDGALLVASINAVLCEQHPAMFDRFKRLCEQGMRAMLTGMGMKVQQFREMEPPPAEVAGRA